MHKNFFIFKFYFNKMEKKTEELKIIKNNNIKFSFYIIKFIIIIIIIINFKCKYKFLILFNSM